MANNKKQTELLENPQARPQPINDPTEAAIEELNELSENGGEISGRIYRIEEEPDGRTLSGIRTFIGVVDCPVDEDFIGRKFGGGAYKLRYRIRTPQGVEKKELLYRVDKSYNRFIKTNETPQAAPNAANVQLQAQSQKGFLEGILNGLTVDKITAFGFAIKEIKELFTPTPAPAPDYMKLIEIMAGNQQKQSVSDAILIKAMDSMGQPRQAAPSLLQQIRDLQAVKEAIKDETENQEQDGENMNFLIKTALEYLPLLLKKNNNDFKAVGQQAAQNPMIQDLIKNDGGLAQQFINAALKQYGPQAAQQLAAGFGYTSQYVPPQAPPVAPQAAPDDYETEENEPEENQGE